MKRCRIGAVSYLNSKPLIYGLEKADKALEVRCDVPSRCAALLHSGEIDVGLIPSVEYLTKPGYSAVAGIGVASDGPVASVALYSKLPVHRIRNIALDTSSRTSAALLRILCAERFEIAPRFSPMGPDLPSMLKENDAALLIGDAAFFTDEKKLGVLKVDLGAEWTSHTGLPFVWALWVHRSGQIDPALPAILSRVRNDGVASIPAIAREFAAGDDATAEKAADYLNRNIEFYLTDRHAAGIELFFGKRSAARHRSRKGETPVFRLRTLGPNIKEDALPP